MVKQTRKPIAIVGLPGSGKSRVGKALAQELGLEHTDTDDVIVELTGKSIPQIFADEGEAQFRELERQAVAQSLSSGGVTSLGGGAIETAAVRDHLRGATVIYIEAEHGELLRRVKRNRKRPLLRDDPDGTLKELRNRRAPLYEAAADITVTTSPEPLRVVVKQALAALSGLHITRVEANPAYPVVSGWDCTDEALETYPLDAKQALLVAAPTLAEQAARLSGRLESRGISTRVQLLADGELAKTLASAESLWDYAGRMHLDRQDIVVTLGGGATTDLGGFVAATWLRGIRVVHFPTTLLAMVDAAVGGKTGINSGAGKNLIGAFHNPELVVSDLSQIETLPQEEYTAGMAEILKAGYIADPAILRLVARNPFIRERTWATSVGRSVLQELVDRAVRVKARVVAADFRESGLRETLNYGHTLAHAIEKQTEYRTRHGEAVSIGMVLAARLAADRNLISEDLLKSHTDVLSGMGLPVSYSGDVDELVRSMYSDKKSRAGQLRFVLLTELGRAETFPIPAEEVEGALLRSVIPSSRP